jgi:hypothetical protein
MVEQLLKLGHCLLRISVGQGSFSAHVNGIERTANLRLWVGFAKLTGRGRLQLPDGIFRMMAT